MHILGYWWVLVPILRAAGVNADGCYIRSFETSKETNHRYVIRRWQNVKLQTIIT
jgi:hypothetical protein